MVGCIGFLLMKVRINGIDYVVIVFVFMMMGFFVFWKFIFCDLFGVEFIVNIKVFDGVMIWLILYIVDIFDCCVNIVLVFGFIFVLVILIDLKVQLSSVNIVVDCNKIGDFFQFFVIVDVLQDIFWVVMVNDFMLVVGFEDNVIQDGLVGFVVMVVCFVYFIFQVGGIKVGVIELVIWVYCGKGFVIFCFIDLFGNKVVCQLFGGVIVKDGIGLDFDILYVWVKIVVDVNVDGKVDWQDVVVVIWDVIMKLIGLGDVVNKVIIYILFNIVFQVIYLFFCILDDVKCIFLVIDGFGQQVLFKGYQVEGYDFVYFDYGGNVFYCVGGMKDFEKFIELGRQWNIDFGIYVNLVEFYFEVNYFGDNIFVKLYQKVWDWMEQFYWMDYVKDFGFGQFFV